jgi:CBS domain-containing protein
MRQDEDIELIATRPVVLVDSQASLRHAAQLLANESIGVAIVRGYHPPALISERDIVSALAEGARAEIDRVDSVMNLDVASAGPHDSIGSVARLMLDNEIRHVPIVQEGAVVRVVSERDVLRALVDDEGTKR